MARGIAKRFVARCGSAMQRDASWRVWCADQLFLGDENRFCQKQIEPIEWDRLQTILAQGWQVIRLLAATFFLF